MRQDHDRPVLGRRALVQGVLAWPAGRSLASGAGPAGADPVHDGPGLRAALRAAAPGSTIMLAPGDYVGTDAFAVATPAIALRALLPLRAVLRAPVEVAGPGVLLEGLAFHGEGDDGLYLAGGACRDSLSITSADVEVRGCDFGFFAQRAILVRPSGLRPYIHDCSFHDNRSLGGNHNVHEAISLGYDNPSSGTSLRARVLRNRMWNLNVEGEAVSVKTSDNLLQDNVLSSSRAGLTNRYGERNVFAGNVLTNTRGIAIGGRDCRLLGNRINGRGSIDIQGGDASPDVTRNGVHPQSVNTYLEGNTGPVVVGGRHKPLPAMNTTIVRQGGTVRLVNAVGTRS
jgi:hypothetical protein